MTSKDFLPTSKSDMEKRDWYYYDFLLVTGDAYVDHPSFGAAVISRVLEAEGYRVCVLAQPNYRNTLDFEAVGKPRYGVFIGAGNLDSMVAHYTASKKRRHEDFYSPGKQIGLRPDRAVMVYSKLAKEAYGDIPVIIGGIEASVRRFAHYDYWDNKIRKSELLNANADILVYGMGELATIEIAKRLSKHEKPSCISNIRGTAVMIDAPTDCAFDYIECPSYKEVVNSKQKYAQAAMIQFNEHDSIRGKAVLQKFGEAYLCVNPPQKPLTTEQFDRVYELPYTRRYHPKYEKSGGVPAIDEIKFSVIHNRGCFGGCNFCALAFHQGRMVTVRSHESVIKEVTELTKDSEFKGYIHDIGGPTANFRRPSCNQQLKIGMCKGRNCLTPSPCKNLIVDHSDYLTLLSKLRKIPGVKKIFIRSGIRFDYLMLDKNGEFFSSLVQNHISGQLKVAPEHCIDKVLDYMGKPHNDVYISFLKKYNKINNKYSKNQFLVPYLISSHPGSTLNDAISLAVYLNKLGTMPEQVQDFYPTPGTISTCMYYTGIDPSSMESVYVPKSAEEKAMQRALLQWRNPANRELVLKALRISGRTDLIGYGENCLIRPTKSRAKKR